jgi:hypothetical protein
MPNSIQSSKFLLDTLVESFFALFDPLEECFFFQICWPGTLTLTSTTHHGGADDNLICGYRESRQIIV